MHMEPAIRNYGRPGQGAAAGPGDGAGDRADDHPSAGASPASFADGWTVATADGSRAAHWEHTVAITPDGPWVLTAAAGEKDSYPERAVASAQAQREGTDAG